ncbi:lipoprotein [Amycolatopsis sp. CA-230715]|uniref:lipoprotein n=1 Tax=Amycolatopsis sp. CA-230715 TaxID=2745196 RepID=UPI001C00E782|nr:lipoprotein [Amycolatopsis sp. CA-230715]QWF79958.1 hypothetical protein HUW46_03371 [Amycolatopsis sp. CA-230715]
MKIPLRAMLPALAAVILLGGCSNASEAGPATPSAAASPAQPGKPWNDELKNAEAGEKVGGTGSPCQLPVTFDVAKGWKPKPVDVGTGSGAGLDALAHQGGFTLKCEIDGKPAGFIGFLRIWAEDAPGKSPRQALEAFVAGDRNVTEKTYRDSGPLQGVEVTYLKDNKALEMVSRARALAVSTASGVVVLALGGLDEEEHQQMLPAYLTAKQSLVTN